MAGPGVTSTENARPDPGERHPCLCLPLSTATRLRAAHCGPAGRMASASPGRPCNVPARLARERARRGERGRAVAERVGWAALWARAPAVSAGARITGTWPDIKRVMGTRLHKHPFLLLSLLLLSPPLRCYCCACVPIPLAPSPAPAQARPARPLRLRPTPAQPARTGGQQPAWLRHLAGGTAGNNSDGALRAVRAATAL